MALRTASLPPPARLLAVCRRCLRPLSTTAAPRAGHNKWSKTKHIKAVTDRKKMAERAAFTKLIAACSRMYGPDAKFNPQLANAVAAATKASVPKALVEAAIARGQGRSVAGAQLEAMTLEVLMPPGIALIADVETDSKTRTLQDLKLVVKKAGAVVGSTAFYFSKRGRAVLRPRGPAPTLAEVLDEFIEHEGATDVEQLADGRFLAWTEPAAVAAITEALSSKFGLDVLESDIVWVPNEDTTVALDSPSSAESLHALLSGLCEYPEVKSVFANIRQGAISDDEWDSIQRHVDV